MSSQPVELTDAGLMTVDEAARALGMSSYRVRHLVNAGALDGRKIGAKGGKTLVLRRSVERMCAGDPEPRPIVIPRQAGLSHLIGTTLTLKVDGFAQPIRVCITDISKT